MEIRMVKCPKCQSVYNEALNMGCPQCSGNVSRGSGFSKTVMPGAGSAPANGFAGVPVSPGAAPSAASFAPGGMGGGNFTPTQPPVEDRFGKTQVVGEQGAESLKMRVVGWIVQISGSNVGKEFRIHTGYNYIGREKGDLQIEGDNFISSANDSQIYYDAETTAFYLSHVNGTNAVRVNGEPVVSGSEKLKAYDIVTIGKTKFVFVPLCNEQFKWEEHA